MQGPLLRAQNATSNKAGATSVFCRVQRTCVNSCVWIPHPVFHFIHTPHTERGRRPANQLLIATHRPNCNQIHPTTFSPRALRLPRNLSLLSPSLGAQLPAGACWHNRSAPWARRVSPRNCECSRAGYTNFVPK